jgi:hypothetical protein
MYREQGSQIWVRCGRGPVEIHHLLTRARGGDLLDKVCEDYHLIALCRDCHRRSDGLDAYMNGLLIEGYVTWDKAMHCPIYKGPDTYLTERYGEVHGTYQSHPARPSYYTSP